MTALDHVVFHAAGHRFAVPVAGVVEIAWFADLVPAPEAPLHVLGLLDVGGSLLPVIDLGLRTATAAGPRQASDQLLILDHEGERFCVVAERIDDVASPDDAQADAAAPSYAASSTLPRIVERVGRFRGRPAFLLDLRRIAPTHDRLPAAEGGAGSEGFTQLARRAMEKPMPPALRETLAARAAALAERRTSAAPEAVLSLARFRLGEERYAIPLREIGEFARVAKLTPIPGCPAHILGASNLRGEVIVLADLRAALDLPVQPVALPTDTIVIRTPEGPAGIVVDGDLDVIDVPLSALDAALSAPSPGAAQGHPTLRHDGSLLTLLDMPRILRSSKLHVQLET